MSVTAPVAISSMSPLTLMCRSRHAGDRREVVAHRFPSSDVVSAIRSDDDYRRRSNHGHMRAVISPVIAIRRHNTARHSYKAYGNQ